MSQLDDLLGGLLGGQGGGGGGLEDVLSQITGGKGGTTAGARAGGTGIMGALLPLIASFLQNGGLNKILSGFRQQGLESRASSWVGTGANEPVSGAEVERVLGEDEISKIARELGISNEQAADAVAEVLPQVVDRVSPEGQLPEEPDLDRLFERIAGRSAPQ